MGPSAHAKCAHSRERARRRCGEPPAGTHARVDVASSLSCAAARAPARRRHNQPNAAGSRQAGRAASLTTTNCVFCRARRCGGRCRVRRARRAAQRTRSYGHATWPPRCASYAPFSAPGPEAPAPARDLLCESANVSRPTARQIDLLSDTPTGARQSLAHEPIAESAPQWSQAHGTRTWLHTGITSPGVRPSTDSG